MQTDISECTYYLSPFQHNVYFQTFTELKWKRDTVPAVLSVALHGAEIFKHTLLLFFSIVLKHSVPRSVPVPALSFLLS